IANAEAQVEVLAVRTEVAEREELLLACETASTLFERASAEDPHDGGLPDPPLHAEVASVQVLGERITAALWTHEDLSLATGTHLGLVLVSVADYDWSTQVWQASLWLYDPATGQRHAV